MEQRIPHIDSKTVKRIIERDFPQYELAVINNILDMYKSESPISRNRVYASILKLSEGNIEWLRIYVENANKDCRDVIACAEYPNYFDESPYINNLPPEKAEQLINSDWKQYEEWLNK